MKTIRNMLTGSGLTRCFFSANHAEQVSSIYQCGCLHIANDGPLRFPSLSLQNEYD